MVDVHEVYIPEEHRGKYAESAALAIAKTENPDKEVKAIYELPAQPAAVVEPVIVETTETTETTEETVVEQTAEEIEQAKQDALLKPDFSKFGEGITDIEQAYQVLENLRKEKEGISNQLLELKEKPAKALNPKVAKLNALIEKTGRDDTDLFSKIISLDVDNADPIEVMLLNKRLANPTVDLDIERKRIERKYTYTYDGQTYKLNEKPEDFDQLEADQQRIVNEEIAIAKADLKDDSEVSRLALKELQNIEVGISEEKQEDIATKIEEAKPIVDSLTKEIVIPFKTPKGLEVNITLTKDMLDVYSKDVAHAIATLKNPSEKDIDAIALKMYKSAIAENISGILDDAISKALDYDRSLRHEKKLEEEVVVDPNKKDVIQPKPKEKSTVEKFVERSKASRDFD